MYWIAYLIPSLTQQILALANLKWFFYYLLARSVIQGPGGKSHLALATLMEVILGITGFFSDFKQVFFVLFVAALSTKPKRPIRLTCGAALVGGAAISLAVVWTT